jgi:hypothetical protein
MGIAIPQVITPSKASGAQVIDGSLLFENGKSQYLKRTAGSGNQKTYTFSTWVKRGVGPARIFGDYTGGSYIGIDFSIRGSDDAIEFHNYSGSSYVDQKISNDKFRDMSGWYHAMFIVDTTESASEDKIKIYVNGRRITSWATNTVGTSTNGNTYGNTATEQRLGYNYQYSDQTLTQTYFIDGQALGPEYFGFTDPLTNTWKPKKYTNTTTTALPVTEAPTLSNGALIIKAEDASIAGTITSASGNLNYYTSSNGVDWTRQGSGTSYTFTAAKYLAAGGSGTQNRTFVPSPNENYSYHVWNDNTNFDVGTDTTADVTGKTFIDADKSNFGLNGFYLPMDGNSLIGEDQSGRGNDWTPVNFGGSV